MNFSFEMLHADRLHLLLFNHLVPVGYHEVDAVIPISFLGRHEQAVIDYR